MVPVIKLDFNNNNFIILIDKNILNNFSLFTKIFKKCAFINNWGNN